MDTTWSVIESDLSADKSLAREFQIPPLVLKLLHNRGYATSEAVRRFLYGSLDDLYDPYLLKGMEQAVRRIMRAIDKNELILIHGDYDVDGITAAALLAKIFQTLKVPFLVYLPHRLNEGYGFSAEAVNYAKERGASLIVTVDCGISAPEEVTHACSLGIDVIVTDHHRVLGHRMPPAVAVVDPWQTDCTYPFKNLSGAGIAYKLARALVGESADQFLDLVALGTVGDIAPLLDENRILVKSGLAQLDKGTNIGLKALAKVACLKSKKTTSAHLAFILGPRLNASGRMGSADCAFQLLIAEDEKEAARLAAILDGENRERQRLEREITKQAIAKAEKEFNFNQDRVVVVWNEGWHPGVIGIVASRLVERFYRPSIVISLADGKGKGSGRSISGFNLFEALDGAQSHLLEFGGHEAAAGLSICESELGLFRDKLNEIARVRLEARHLTRNVAVDSIVRLEDLSYEFLRQLELLEPFGSGNRRPVFLTHELKFKGSPIRYDGKSLRARVTDGTQIAELLWQRPRDFFFDEDGSFDLIYSPGLRRWEGMDGLVLEVKDLRYVRQPS
ncbi:MAG: single-stranded-DNA-specific exonuclease RecJ [Candidatus Omnitrophica bacterium]|nr:single-stranded-DNA-specific exonuclease RecJ [Candidatus Omnitrophota bacterium]